MDAERAAAKLEEVLSMIGTLEARAERHQRGNTFASDDPEYGSLQASIRGHLPAVERIAELVDRSAAEIIAPQRSKVSGGKTAFDNAKEGIERALGAVRGQRELEEILGPSGPKLSAGHLHRWVWEPAATRWDTGQRRDALRMVEDATVVTTALS
jgi:hypothetical protein